MNITNYFFPHYLIKHFFLQTYVEDGCDLLASCGTTNLIMQLWSLDMQYISLYSWAFLVNGFAYYFSHLFGNVKMNMLGWIRGSPS